MRMLRIPGNHRRPWRPSLSSSWEPRRPAAVVGAAAGWSPSRQPASRPAIATSSTCREIGY